MNFDDSILKYIEQLGYRMTAADLSSKSGLNIDFAQQELLKLASATSGELEVSNTGDILFIFPKNFRNVLRSKFLKFRLKEWWRINWKILFYIIRVSFGLLLIISLIFVGTLLALISTILTRGDSADSIFGNLIIFLVNFVFNTDVLWLLSYEFILETNPSNKKGNISFLAAIFSFIFGDGNPNFDLEERRWSIIGQVVTNNYGAVVAEQIAPYLDEINQDNEDYVLPVLIKFNGFPEVSPSGEIIYHFPDLQVTANQSENQEIPPYLKEYLWKFSRASTKQLVIIAGLVSTNFILSVILGILLKGNTAIAVGGLLAFTNSVYWVLLTYSAFLLPIPLIRYIWIKFKNRNIKKRNKKRASRASLLDTLNDKIKKKLEYARSFAFKKVFTNKDVVYQTETNLLDQEFENKSED